MQVGVGSEEDILKDVVHAVTIPDALRDVVMQAVFVPLPQIDDGSHIEQPKM